MSDGTLWMERSVFGDRGVTGAKGEARVLIENMGVAFESKHVALC